MISTEEKVDLDIDLDRPVICETEWVTDDGRFPCHHKADWTGVGHDEVDTHADNQTLLCDTCLKLVKRLGVCRECEVPLIKDLRRL